MIPGYAHDGMVGGPSGEPGAAGDFAPLENGGLAYSSAVAEMIGGHSCLPSASALREVCDVPGVMRSGRSSSDLLCLPTLGRFSRPWRY